MDWLYRIIFLLLMTWSGTLGAYYFQKGTKEIQHLTQALSRIELYVGGCFYGFSSILNILLLRYIPYTILYPMTALTYVWTMIFSRAALGEKISPKKLMALCFIIVGVIFVNL